MAFSELATNVAAVMELLTFAHVRAMSTKASIPAKIPTTSTGNPMVKKSAVAIKMPPPGTPAVPSDTKGVKAMMMITCVMVTSPVVAFKAKIASNTGQTPAQPAIPTLVPSEPTKPAMLSETPTRLVKQSI